MKRINEPELLDEHDAPPEDVARPLRDLRRFNRWCGGIGVYRRLLRRLVGRITRFDAPASVRRGYTVPEAREIAGKVAAARRDVVSAFPYRFGILLWKR